MDAARVLKGLPPRQKTADELVEPHRDLVWAWAGFWRLSNSRPSGMGGPLRIPFSEIESYCRFMEYDTPKRIDFLIYAERMDTAFMKHVTKEMADKSKNNNNAKTGDDEDITPPPPPASV